MKKVRMFTAAALLLVTLGTALLSGSFAYAAIPITGGGGGGGSSPGDAKSNVCQGIGLTDASGTGCGDNGTQVNSVLSTGINILSAVIGVAAVIMIILAGMRFITSSGDPGKIAGARSAVLYAVIGLVVVAVAQVLVRFVINKAAGQ